MMVMSREARRLYEFGPFCLDATERLLMRGGKVVSLPPKVFETLLVLVEHRGHILEKDELMKTLWPDTFVEESSLAQNVFLLRKALGEGQAEERYIETIPRRGYRFVAGVREVRNDGTEIIAGRRTETRIVIEEEEESGEHERQVVEKADAEKIVQAQAAPPQAEGLINQALRDRKWLLAALASLALSGLALGLYYFSKQRQPAGKATASFQKMRINKLTSDGRTTYAALSPDGKYLAQVLEQGGEQSLWVRQVATTSNVQVVPPAELRYRGVTFSADGVYIYYVAYEKNHNLGTLSVVPTLGGTPRKLVEDVDSPAAVSPDGKRLAFERNYPSRWETVLIVVNADGTGEKTLLTRKRPDYFSTDGPSWSPDGKMLACAAGSRDAHGPYMTVVGVNVDDGTEKPLTTQRWNYVGQVAWQDDGQGLVVVASQGVTSLLAEQIWQIYTPGGEARRITNDLSGYRGVSLSADSRTLATVQSTRVSHIYVAPSGEINRAAQITSGLGDHFSERLGMAWTPDGRIVYGSTASGNPDIWVMDADGRHQRQLTMDERPDLLPCVTPDGRYIVFVSERQGASNIWRMDLEGGNLKQLTQGSSDYWPSVSSDGQSVIYWSGGKEKTTLRKVPLDGGESVPQAEGFVSRPLVSPDGKLIVGYVMDDQTSQMWVSVMPTGGGTPNKLFRFFPLPVPPMIRWSADSGALTYISSTDNFTNIWSRPPINDGQPRQLTNFQSDRIFRFAWSTDGKQLAYERGMIINDIILISDFK
jgi:Tol biopolymer transport system component/DNA-binding winged helix-turn-helix (wHTH) protein